MPWIHLLLSVRPSTWLNEYVMTQPPSYSPLDFRSVFRTSYLNKMEGIFFFSSFVLFRAALVAYGGSQASDRIGAVATGLRQSQGSGNARSLNHWARPGIKPTTSWFLVGFVNHWVTTGIPRNNIFRRGVHLANLTVFIFVGQKHFHPEGIMTWHYKEKGDIWCPLLRTWGIHYTWDFVHGHQEGE